MKERYLFFVSSTYNDLIEVRHQVMQAIMDEGHFPIGMENFPASGKSPLESIKEHLECCDYLILILGDQYGSINTESGISYTEEEYIYAVEHHIPVLAFLKSSPKSSSPSKTNKTTTAKKLTKFRERVSNGKITIKNWDSSKELKSLVKSSIHYAIEHQPRPGWIRKEFVSKKNCNTRKRNITCVSLKDGNYIIKIDDVEFKMIHVEGDTFMMGATSEQEDYAKKEQQLNKHEIDALMKKERPLLKKELTDFWIGETQVTQELWEKIMGYNPSYFSKLHNYIEIPNLPVEQVTWNDCQEFIKLLNDAFKSKLKGDVEFDFPSEAQWEFAARGGKKSKGFVFAGGSVGEVARYAVNSEKTYPVKSLAPNELGLYDMSGNVWEWCKDIYTEYSGKGEDNSNGKRVGRGGCWHSEKNCCRVSFREKANMTHAGNGLGLRLVLNKKKEQ